MGLAIASLMRDMQGFSLIMNFIMVPMFLLSGAMFPIKEFPVWVQSISLINPLLYGVDGLRYAMVGTSQFSPALNFSVLLFFCAVMVGFGAFLFSRVDVD